MTEQQNFETEPDDVEAHRKPPPRSGVTSDDKDDVEGHRMKLERVQPGYDEDDVEGHVMRKER